MGKFETKKFTMCDECVTVKTTVEDIIGSLINADVTRYEVYMAVHDLLDRYLDEETHKILMDKIKELV